MSKVKVIVRGRAGIGRVPVLLRLHNLLTAGSLAEVSLGPTAKDEIGDLDTSVGMGIAGVQIELELEQEPRNSYLPSEGRVQEWLTPDEWTIVQSRRAVDIAGCPIHNRRSGDNVRYYMWSWGRQPEGAQRDEILDENPVEAAKKFIALYQRGQGDWSCVQPTRRKVAA
ncbi:hypothetical protein AB6809_29670 [Paraburkholderia sp. RCC_158]|uniref:hypothetical protein n=1 Tax=Paraburkholderia sp. RCC_158 TaxID=3239220 RepID=UPI0035268C96